MTDSKQPQGTGALDGLLVLDFGQGVSAPHCARLFADYGADVIKIEPRHGDAARSSGPYRATSPTSSAAACSSSTTRTSAASPARFLTPRGARCSWIWSGGPTC